jgi:hypothetical protein
MGSIYIEFPIYELSDIENDWMKACSFGKLEVVGAPKPSTYGVPESGAFLLDVSQLALSFLFSF